MEKLTDAEVVKCLESRMPFDEVCVVAYDLIKRKDAYIEDLKKANKEMFDRANELYKEIEKLKRELVSADEVIGFREEEIKRLRSGRLINADELFTKFAGHSVYDGDTILCIIECMAEGKIVNNARPLNTSEIKSKAYKEFAERLHDNFISTVQKKCCRLNNEHSYKWTEGFTVDDVLSNIDNTLKELTEGNNGKEME